jgi:hypothetical protein
MDHGKKKMMVGGKMKVKKMPGGGMMKKKMPMYMYGGKVFKDGGTMLEGILSDPAQAKAAAKNPNVRKQMGM